MARPCTDKQGTGQRAELKAREFLTRAGLSFIAGNYHCRYGELDLVMLTADTLIIVEVRYRRPNNLVSPTESISTRKQRRIIRATEHFLTTHPRYRHHPVRFDVVGITGSGTHSDIDWLPAAFTMDDLKGR